MSETIKAVTALAKIGIRGGKIVFGVTFLLTSVVNMAQMIQAKPSSSFSKGAIALSGLFFLMTLFMTILNLGGGAVANKLPIIASGYQECTDKTLVVGKRVRGDHGGDTMRFTYKTCDGAKRTNRNFMLLYALYAIVSLVNMILSVNVYKKAEQSEDTGDKDKLKSARDAAIANFVFALLYVIVMGAGIYGAFTPDEGSKDFAYKYVNFI